ncbi:hypothetical protein [Massilia genomosp. 1]|uniref:Immunity protein 22 n=1 Tax=Massilia genomosp. 1 TaxID=2609280 RepID=A0ABX0MLH3_9BURK|nr:hypothetical protein [Massilia genomosp. 1]NHZ63645.1 hypothetical protein [Massilia genomosp. 1]
MTTPDRSDEDDFYTQDFERDGFVSVWVGKTDARHAPRVDILQELCGVGYDRLDDQEANSFDFDEVPLHSLLKDISCSTSFMDEVLRAAGGKGCLQARWVALQYEFAYDPAQVTRPIADDPIFIGAFPFTTDDE